MSPDQERVHSAIIANLGGVKPGCGEKGTAHHHHPTNPMASWLLPSPAKMADPKFRTTRAISSVCIQRGWVIACRVWGRGYIAACLSPAGTLLTSVLCVCVCVRVCAGCVWC
jgi:hypothetical protein